jgi:hypothetical protein
MLNERLLINFTKLRVVAEQRRIYHEDIREVMGQKDLFTMSFEFYPATFT